MVDRWRHVERTSRTALMGHHEDERLTKAGYDRWAASYDDKDPSTWLDEPFLLEYLQPFPGCRILDIGCGTGRYLRRFASAPCRITGVDLSRNMLVKARQYHGASTDVCLVQASAGALPFTSSSFDRIMSGLLVDHMTSAGQLFDEIATLLTPNGHAVVAAVHPDMQRLTGRDITIQEDQSERIHIPGHVHEVHELLAAIGGAGLAVVAMEEPPVTSAMIEHRPTWKHKLGRPALLLVALTKRNRNCNVA
ncbi:MAG TPA: class I SAM-dependent methyltransferase [Nitrospira sp.]|nr:class I SAM-dependent methyltransferase [Nitrospira sp.]